MTDVPPSFEFLPGDADSPVVLHVPHSAREIPADVRPGIVLDDAGLERELDHITDSHTAAVAASRSETASVIASAYGRKYRSTSGPGSKPSGRSLSLCVVRV